MQLCIALDLENKDKNLNLLKQIKEFDNIWIKVGLRSYIRDGKKFLDDIKNINPNFKIFLDLKLYDIPNTMADASEEIAKLNIEMFNIHASAGYRAMNEVMKRLNKLTKRPIVLAVTALTSFNESEFKEIYNSSIEIKAKEFAINAYKANLDGVVCSVYESLDIKKNTSKEFLTLTPGIRPFGENSNDQKRVATIANAKDNLSDFIVIGRPIYQASNPKEVIKKIIEKL